MDETHVTISIPRWYQDLSIPQMRNVFSLGDIIRADYAERVTRRTQRVLGDIGVTSTFVKITPEQIRKSSRSTDLDPVKFLCEIYRIVTGKYFIEEEYKKAYDCNERIILSAIAFLTLPEIVVELHRRIPMGAKPKFPPKPLPPPIQRRIKAKSPYLEPFFTRPDWLTYKKELFLWRKKCENIPIPRVILPPFCIYPKISGDTTSIVDSDEIDKQDAEKIESYQNENIDKDNDYENENETSDKIDDEVYALSEEPIESRHETGPRSHYKQASEVEEEIKGQQKLSRKKSKSDEQQKQKEIFERKSKIHDENGVTNKTSVTRTKSGRKSRKSFLPHKKSKNQANVGETDKFSKGKPKSDRPRRLSFSQKRNKAKDRSANEHSKHPDSQNNKKKPRFDKPFNSEERGRHLIVTGVTKNDDSSNVSITHETSGIACVTPSNSDESFFQALNIIETKKSYPRGREYLSRNWQEWFQNVDEEFMKIEKEANKILKSVDETLKLMGPKSICDGCCSCRQTRKANMIYHKTKTPRMVIDSIAMDGERNKFVVGSISMNSPAPSLSESMSNIPDVVESHDNVIKNKIINCMTNEKGEINYYITGISKDIEHVPRKIIDNSNVKKMIKNVPPCGCIIEKTMNEGITGIISDDNIPWTKKNDICIGRKYRPTEIGASSCQDYPYDKTCRRNPFRRKIEEEIKAERRKEENSDNDYYPVRKKNMYSLAAFQPCGDEDGMAICGGPWGAVNIPDEEELARREAEAKLIRESPPCGDKPGRAICGAPFGSRHPIPKKPKKDDDEDEDEEESEEEEPEKKRRGFEGRRKKVVENIEKQLNRDDRCSTVVDKNGQIVKPNETSSRSASKTEPYKTSKSTARDKRRKSLAHQDERDKRRHKSKSESQSQTSIGTESSVTEKKSKREKRHDAKEKRRSNEIQKMKKDWNRMKIMANNLISAPVKLPEEPSGKCVRETGSACCKGKKVIREEESTKEGPFGWKTASEEALPVEKTLLYLTEPDEPMERIPVRPGGKPCKCRENRNARKKLLYNVSGITRDGNGKLDVETSRVIDGLMYITPIPSVRNSEEYIAEYELYESPYDKCSRKRKDDEYKYIEKYLGPKSLMKKQPRGPIACKCSSMREKIVDSDKQESGRNEEDITRKKIVDSAKQEMEKNNKESMKIARIDEKKWSKACEDAGLREFYTRCRDNVPCWLRCVEFSKDGCCMYPRRLQIKRPVCECKYERKILKRNEEKKNWLDRQKRFKSYKKQPQIRIEGLSRPMHTETELIISDVKRLVGHDDSGDDHPQYCISGIKQDRVMASGENIVSGIGMCTPEKTPEPSKPDLPIAKVHRHWSPMNVQAPLSITGSTGTLHLSQSIERSWRRKLRGTMDKRVDVLFRNDRVNGKDSQFQTTDASIKQDKSLSKNVYQSGEYYDADNNKEQDDANHNEKNQHPYRSSGRKDEYRSKEISGVHRSMEQEDKSRSVERKSTSHGKKKNTVRHSKRSNDTRRSTKADKPIKMESVSPAQQLHDYEKSEHERRSTGKLVQREETAVPGYIDKDVDLNKLMEIELKKMADEGFLFAKLPACYQMPQLQYWIMYRKGIALPLEERKNLMERSMKIWKSLEKKKTEKIKAPPLELSNEVMKNLNWDQADKIKQEAASKRMLFYSHIRKSRVLQSRAMWGLMEFGKFPGVAFKRTFFAYQASKESDGFVFKPWQIGETSGSFDSNS